MNKGCEIVECKMDNLTEELLLIILSFLSIKEAARTSVVSRRWRYLWKYTSCLEVYDKDNSTTVQQVADEYINLVDHVMKLLEDPTLDQFRVGVCYYSRWSTYEPFYRWVNFAIQKEVKIFELNLAGGRQGHVVRGYQYVFPDIERMSSKQKISRFCCNLKSLTLINVTVSAETIHFFLSNCPCLEHVCVSGSNVLQNLKVTRPIKSMEISWCPIVGLEVIDAYNLEYFTYIGPAMELVPNFQNAPRLTELTIGREYCYSFIFEADRHISYSSKLGKLKLKVPTVVMLRSWKTFTYPNNFPRLDNLRVLELELKCSAGDSLLFYTFFTKASPLLSKFTARITYVQVTKELIDRHEATHFVHEHLKVVKLIGFTGCTTDFNLALNLLEIGVQSLKKIILQPTNDHHTKVRRMTAASIEMQSKQLEAKLPPGVELVLL